MQEMFIKKSRKFRPDTLYCTTVEDAGLCSLLPFFLNRTRAFPRHASPLLNIMLVLFLSIGLHFRTARDSDVVVLLHLISVKAVTMVDFPEIRRKICLLRGRKD